MKIVLSKNEFMAQELSIIDKGAILPLALSACSLVVPSNGMACIIYYANAMRVTGRARV